MTGAARLKPGRGSSFVQRGGAIRRPEQEEGRARLGGAVCPSSDDLRPIAGFRKGGFGSSLIEIMQHAVDAASDGLRLFVV